MKYLNPACSLLVSRTLIVICFLLFAQHAALAKDIRETHIESARVAKYKKLSRNPKSRISISAINSLSPVNKKLKVIVLVTEDTGSRTLKRNISVPASRKKYKNIVENRLERITGNFHESKVKVERKFVYSNGFSAEVSLDGLEQLLEENEVSAVFEDIRRRSFLKEGIDLIDGEQTRSTFGGSNVAISIIDTGIDYNNTYLGGADFPNSKVIGGFDFVNNDNDPWDDEGHGTAVAAIAAGDVRTASPSNLHASYIGGVSPSSKLYALKVLDQDGVGWDSDILAAIEWSITNQYNNPAYPIKVINLSLGGDEYSSNCDGDTEMQPYLAAVENANNAGITIFAASGNEGYTNSISAPACLSGIVSVGEVYDKAQSSSTGPWQTAAGSCYDRSITSDLVPCYSNAGELLDMLAPGADALTPKQCSELCIGESFSLFNGTSAASPYAAGAAALLQSASLQYRGEYLSPPALRDLLINTGDPVTDPKNTETYPRLNIHNAIRTIIQPSDINLDNELNFEDAILSLQLFAGGSLATGVSSLAESSGEGLIGLDDTINSLQIAAEVCVPNHMEFCTTEQSCSAAGLYWYDDQCHILSCDDNHFDLCSNLDHCQKAGGFWFDSICHSPDDEYESNDTLEEAAPIHYNSPVTAYLPVYNDSDWFVVENDKPRTVEIILNANSDKANWRIEVFTAQGELVDTIYPLNDSSHYLHLPDAGLYYYCVKRRYFEATQMPYELNIATDSGIVESESNNTKAEANAIPLDLPVAGTIEGTSDQDWYVFNAGSAQSAQVTFSVASEEYWKVEVYDSNDTLLVNLTVIDGRSFNVFLPESQDIYIVVTNPRRETDTAQYNLKMSAREDQDDFIVESEPNDTQDVADTIRLGNSLTGSIPIEDDIDWYTISVDQPVNASVSFSTGQKYQQGTFWPCFWNIEIINSRGDILSEVEAKDEDRFNIRFPEVGVYYIKVRYSQHYFADSSTRMYQLKIIPDENQNELIVETEVNNDEVSADAIALDKPVSGIISFRNTDEDWFYLDVTEPGTFLVSVNDKSNAFNIDMKVIGTGGEILITERIPVSGDFEILLPVEGRYYFVMSNIMFRLFGLVGEYEFTVTRQ